MTEEKVVKEKEPRIEQNGVVRPKAGSETEKPWLIADEISAEKGSPASRKEVVERAVSQGVNKATASTQYGKWRTFNNVKAAPAPKKIKVAKPPKAPKDKKKKEAEVAPVAEDPTDAEYEATTAEEAGFNTEGMDVED